MIELDYETRKLLKERVSDAMKKKRTRSDRLGRPMRTSGAHHKPGTDYVSSHQRESERKWAQQGLTIDGPEVFCEDCGKRTKRLGRTQRHEEGCIHYEPLPPVGAARRRERQDSDGSDQRTGGILSQARARTLRTDGPQVRDRVKGRLDNREGSANLSRSSWQLIARHVAGRD